jgi:hypothetical protein
MRLPRDTRPVKPSVRVISRDCIPDLGLRGVNTPSACFFAFSFCVDRLLLSRAVSQPLLERRRGDAGVLAGQQDIAGHRLIKGSRPHVIVMVQFRNCGTSGTILRRYLEPADKAKLRLKLSVA